MSRKKPQTRLRLFGRHVITDGEYRERQEEFREKAEHARLLCHAKHKRNPAALGLKPHKVEGEDVSYCEDAGIDRDNIAIAKSLLRQAFEFGLVKVGTPAGRWPELVWAVHDGWTFQAHLTQSQDGTYHGYPLAKNEDFAKDIQKCFHRRQAEGNGRIQD